jgi:predicted amidophosphoribosyltransferase
MLAAAVSAASGVPIAAGALKRVKFTAQQVGLSRPERATNVQGAFRVPAEGKPEVVGRRLLLVDDVLTSGATAEGCAKALLRAGARHVDVLVFARVAEAGRTSI